LLPESTFIGVGLDTKFSIEILIVLILDNYWMIFI